MQNDKGVKRLNMEAKTFMANGNKYHYGMQLSIERFVEYEKMNLWAGFGMEFDKILGEIKTAYGLLNKSKPADAAVILKNLDDGVTRNVDSRTHPMLNLCALYINREGENEKVVDLKLMDEKIEDWRKEGYAISDFFQLAFNFINGFIPIYNESIQAISKSVKEKGKELNSQDKKKKR